MERAILLEFAPVELMNMEAFSVMTNHDPAFTAFRDSKQFRRAIVNDNILYHSPFVPTRVFDDPLGEPRFRSLPTDASAKDTIEKLRSSRVSKRYCAIAAVFLPTIEIILPYIHLEVLHDQAPIALELEMHRRETGRYPVSLPKKSASRHDPLAGFPYTYRRERHDSFHSTTSDRTATMTAVA